MDGKGGHAIGIDLGTTYSCVGVWQRNRVEIIVNDQGNRTTPSHVAFTDKERLVGDAAFNQVIRNPTNSIFGMGYLHIFPQPHTSKIPNSILSVLFISVNNLIYSSDAVRVFSLHQFLFCLVFR